MNVESSVLILLIIVSLVFGQNDVKNITSNEITIHLQNVTLPPPTTTTTPIPLKTICNQIETCQHYDKIKTEEYQDLRTRKCMCDQGCPLYEDCCEDSILYQNTSGQKNYTFSCELAPFNGYVYMVKECALDYNDSLRIIENCHTTNRTSLVRNFLLSLPVTNVLKKITYKNAYCAICNHEPDFDFWQPKLYFDIDKQDFDIIALNTSEPLRSNKTHYEFANSTTVLNNLAIDENRAELISKVEGVSYLCSILPNIDGTVLPGIRYCLPDPNKPLCSDCEKSTTTNSCIIAITSFDDKKLEVLDLGLDLPRINYSCIDIPGNIRNKNVLCQSPTAKASGSGNSVKCFIKKGEKDCLVNSNYEPGSYRRLKNGSVYIKDYDYAFPPGQHYNTTVPNVIYICGTEIPTSKYVNIRATLRNVLIKVSIFFLVVYMITNVNKQKLQSLPNKILFSFCITLLLLYSVHQLSLGRENNCQIHAILKHYLYLSCFAWLLIASYDFWVVICRSSTKLQTLAGKTRLKRYLVYCFFGWISPLSILAVALYFEFSPTSVISCIYKPGYGRLKQCFIAQQDPRRYFYTYPAAVIYFFIIVLFSHTSYHIYLSKRKNIKSTAQNNYYMLFLKLALTMGVTWTIGACVSFTDLEIFKFLYDILNPSQGTLLYFLYGFQCTTLTKMYEKHKNDSIVQQTKSTFFSITDKIKVPSSRATSSVDPPTQEMESTN